MTNIVDLMSKVVERWNAEKKCGFCWEYEAPQRESDLNESVKKSEDCCVRVFLTRFRIMKNREYNRNSHYKVSQSNAYSFTLNIFMYDDVGTNVYLEQAGHPLEESKWKRILEPLMMCLNDLDFCAEDAVLKYGGESWDMVIDGGYDDNYTGWSINFILNEQINV